MEISIWALGFGLLVGSEVVSGSVSEFSSEVVSGVDSVVVLQVALTTSIGADLVGLFPVHLRVALIFKDF